MNSLRLVFASICCSILLLGCNTQRGQDFDHVMLNEVTFLIPRNLTVTKAEEIENGAVFEIEGLWGELSNNRLVVMGKSYGEISAGDEVQFKSDGTFLINGSAREPSGFGNNTVESEGTIYIFPGRTLKQIASDDGSTVVEFPDGTTYMLTDRGIVIDGHEYGPYAANTVVKIDPDGTVAFNP